MVDASSLLIVLIGAFAAGFTTGLAGFGTGLVASGLWFHAPPASMVPPLVVLTGVGMSVSGQINRELLIVAGLCLPVTLLGAWIGARVYTGIGEAAFRMVILVLLLASGMILIGQTAGTYLTRH